MVKYDEATIKELAKMGVIVNAQGDNLSKETSLERTMRVKTAEVANQKLSLSKPLITSIRFSNAEISRIGVSVTAKFSRPGSENFSEAERKSKGLVTKRQKGIVYTLLKDDTKVCRCCQDRKPKNFFGNHQSTSDKLRAKCRDCEHTSGLDYLAAKAA